MSAKECEEAFDNFIRVFSPDSESSPYYLTIIQAMDESKLIDSTYILNVDLSHIYNFNDKLYQSIIQAPRQIISLMDLTLEGIFEQYHPDSDYPIQVRFFNHRVVTPIRNLGPEHIGTLVSIYGMISRVSYIIPQMYTAYFECSACHFPKVLFLSLIYFFRKLKLMEICKL